MVLRPFIRRHLPFLIGGETHRGGGGAAGGAGAAIYDGYQRSETKTKISSAGGKRKSKSNVMSGYGGSAVRSWVGGGGGRHGRRATGDTDSTFVNGGDVELGKVEWPLESGRGDGRKGREVRSESEENIIEPPVPVSGGIVKTVKVDVR